MELISIVLLVIVVVYLMFLLQLSWGFGKIKLFETKGLAPKTGFTIVVPFRNEENNLPKLLRSFSQLNYPIDLVQVIMIDDFSTDTSSKVYNQWRMNHETVDTTLLENLILSNSPKKDALGRAIPVAKHDWVITTDADCTVDANWLLVLDNYIQTHSPEMIVGSVVYATKNNWFHHFQQLDLLGLQGTTIGSFGIGKPFMCNGANFAYTKKLFQELGGFGGITDTASGDDVLLLQKAVNSQPEKVHYLKSTDFLVHTKPENDLFRLFMQRVRWAGKTTNYKNGYAKMLAVVVLLTNLALVAGCVFMSVGKLDWKFFLTAFLIKYVADYVLLLQSNAYLRKGKFFVPMASSVLYPVFSSLVGLYALVFGFTWKGRKFRK